MGKLFNLKEWLTVRDAAKHLSNICAEEISEADVLRLALDGHLKLALNFVNNARARRGRPIPLTMSEVVHAIASRQYPDEFRWHFGDGALVKASDHYANLAEHQAKMDEAHPIGIPIAEGKRYLVLESKMRVLKGIWDLTMLGAERDEIEFYYHHLTGGPPVTRRTSRDGVLVESEDGKYICQLLVDREYSKYQAGSMAHGAAINEQIASGKVTGAQAENLLNEYKAQRSDFVERRKENQGWEKEFNNFVPAWKIPRDSVLVVRTSALRKFEQSISAEDQMRDKPLTTRERNGLLTVIAALCDYSDIKPSEHGAAARISRLTDDIGAPLGAAAIKKYLDDIPQALESKRK